MLPQDQTGIHLLLDRGVDSFRMEVTLHLDDPAPQDGRFFHSMPDKPESPQSQDGRINRSDGSSLVRLRRPGRWVLGEYEDPAEPTSRRAVGFLESTSLSAGCSALLVEVCPLPTDPIVIVVG